jgi:hypothetical protein
MKARTYEADAKDDFIRLKLTGELKVKAFDRARKQGMTLSRYIRTLIERDLTGARAIR